MQKLIEDMLATIARLEGEVSALTRQLERKDAQIEDLRQRLAQYEKPKKGSGNSSVPPTQDSLPDQIRRHTKSLLPKSERKPGGQPGHKGHTQSINIEPTSEVSYKPCVCECCGAPLDDAECERVSRHLEIDYIVVPVVTAHAAYRCKCHCGHTTTARLPKDKANRSCFGPHTQATVAYLSNEQCVPYGRLRQTMRDIFGLTMSEGTIRNILKRAGELARYPYEVIRQMVESAKVIGGDETGVYVAGNLHWAWTFQNEGITYIFQDSSRGIKAVNAHFPGHFPNATLVTDRHSTYLNLDVESHQVCLAHILRNLEYLNDLDAGQTWSGRFQEMIRDSLDAWKDAGKRPVGQALAEQYRRRLDELLSETRPGEDKEFESTRKGLAKWEKHFFTFLTTEGVPPDNNGSERAIRNIKVKQKVSGAFRTNLGADIYMMLKSITETAHKNGQSKFAPLLALYSLQP